MDVPASIPVRAARLTHDQQALVAVTFTLMSAHLHGGDDTDREETAAQIAAHLEELCATEGLDDQFRRLCARLHALWERAAER